MQDRYVGDIGDFSNNGLLRWLIGMREDVVSDGLGPLRLGVVWYLNEPTEKKSKTETARKSNISAKVEYATRKIKFIGSVILTFTSPLKGL